MSEGNVWFFLARKLITLSTILKQVWALTIEGERTRNSSTRGRYGRFVMVLELTRVCITLLKKK